MRSWGGIGRSKIALRDLLGDLGRILGVLRMPCRRIGVFRGDLGGSCEDLGSSLGYLLGGLGGLEGNIAVFSSVN